MQITLYEKRWPQGSVWPLPQKWKTSEKVFSINPREMHFDFGDIQCDIIDEAIHRYKKLLSILPESHNFGENQNLLNSYEMQIVKKQCGSPKLGDDESYEITVPYKHRKILLKSNTVWGMLRAMETISQLVYISSTSNVYLINETKIEDWPRFTHRGVMIDSARHFIPMSTLLRNLDAMSYNKMNVFHWHLIDDQSFPFESKQFPNLTKLVRIILPEEGAYSSKHVYTQRDVKKVIHEARLRGIRVIPEIDTPGHTQSFGKAFPNLLTKCYSDGKAMQEIYGKHAKQEILNPISNYTYDLLTTFFKEIRQVFSDDFIHLGMDEVYYDCWLSNPDIQLFMKMHNLTNVNQVEQFYVENTLKNVRNIGFKSIVWQDPADNGVESFEMFQVPNDTIIQIWKDSQDKTWKDYMAEITEKNRQTILSSCWYLNYISYGQDWRKLYSCDPHDFKGSEEQKSHVIGGEACLWSEYVDATNLLSRLCNTPRASAVAERLWSDPLSTAVTGDAMFRLDEQRCRMLRTKY
ncbi:beta-hexosaminidase subunit alpha-like protein [Leptotrombidium deliense]|uniref:Beta-hexosaminidase n=1 Tax=Leptotrombidium deliense TaxID=299467 RepID=A0A443SQ38_9ACAR|nr:beta-hexosaminidase subunit alpha-like protein [Leptotrombidium deliense]